MAQTTRKRRRLSKQESFLRAVRKVDAALDQAYRHPEMHETDLGCILAVAAVMHAGNRLSISVPGVVKG